jgi:hypothetical protein
MPIIAIRTIRASQFWGQFAQQLQQVGANGYGRDWTKGMYDVLHRVQRGLGALWCQCGEHPTQTDGGSNERLRIDMLWFEADSGLAPDEEQWAPPLVAIEHENDYSAVSQASDHWKVSQVASRLRVFIGYSRQPRNVETEARILQARESRWMAVPNGEALLIFGHRDMNVSDFRAWSAPQGRSEWTELSRGAG